ncbi:hypothetical protein [Caulobacter radicis]|uniref:Uncharacterized protein n=1 Tax=Caulobacter radicis TaxID=2172650 RepID=A0A2T9JD92_9CAUL|nr:hypothetical protein [Caulobacter radicis]PVM80885.1 hypothetical protein DDF65_13190 [Caulobacter radicis]
MKRRTAIIALGLMAVPVVFLFVFGFGATFWDGYGPRGYSRSGVHRDIAPVLFISGLIAAGLWWAAWLKLRARRLNAGTLLAPTSQIPSLVLAAWFLILLGVLACLAANNASAPF